MDKINKRGASVIIGYVLLVTFGLIMSGIAYTYLKTYVPTETISCPEDSSLFINEITCTNGDILNITLKNNGKFNIEGFIINSAGDVNDEIATDNLNLNFVADSLGSANTTDVDIRYVQFDISQKNNFKPNAVGSYWFNLSKTTTPIVSNLIEIIPVIFDKTDGKENLALCSNAKITQTISCG